MNIRLTFYPVEMLAVGGGALIVMLTIIGLRGVRAGVKFLALAGVAVLAGAAVFGRPLGFGGGPVMLLAAAYMWRGLRGTR